MGLGGSDNPARGKGIRPGRGRPPFPGERKHEQGLNAWTCRAGASTGDSALTQSVSWQSASQGKGANTRLFVRRAHACSPDPHGGS